MVGELSGKEIKIKVLFEGLCGLDILDEAS